METPENEYIVIPNPLYDVVFKYLMEDIESAKIVISTLINEKITKLVFEPISHAEKIKTSPNEQEIRLFHLDFLATIEKPDGSEELIMIELQKANQSSDIFRFKRYISANFQRKRETEIINPKTQAIEKVQLPIRLLPIFILNFRIEKELNDLIIKTNRLKMGVFREKILQENNEFIDNLSFDMWVVQLPNLSKISPSEYENDEYKRKLYALLQLFDQNAQKTDNQHRLLFLRHLFPDFLQRLINRLKAADSENPDLEEQMHAEDEYLAELIKRDNEISYYKGRLGEATEKLEKTAGELEKEKRVNQEREKTLLEKDRLILDLAKSLKEVGFSLEQIQEKTGLAREIIEQL